MIDQAHLLNYIGTLQAEAASWGGALRVEIGEPASPQALAECEKKLDTALPLALITFLRQMNGLSVFFYTTAEVAVAMPDAWSDVFQIFDTTLIATYTLGLREFFDDVASGPRGPAEARERGRTVLTLSSESHTVTYLPLDRLDAAGSCPVMTFDEERYDDWLTEPFPDPVASSLEEHVWKSLDSLSRTRRTFMYWVRLSD